MSVRMAKLMGPRQASTAAVEEIEEERIRIRDQPGASFDTDSTGWRILHLQMHFPQNRVGRPKNKASRKMRCQSRGKNPQPV